MIVLINGPFGVGKTTLAESLRDSLPGSIVFDPEWCGEMLRATLGPVDPREDFQLYPSWSELVVATIASIRDHYENPIIVPMCLYLPDVADPVIEGLSKLPDFRHFCLQASVEVIQQRLVARGHEPNGWECQRTKPALEAQALFKNCIFLDATSSVQMLTESVIAQLAPSIKPQIP